jgi:predicted phage-related endonuclease
LPDPTRKTVSATESPALYNASPYLTRWMLYQRFRNGVLLDGADDARMSWGSRMEPLVLDQAAKDLGLIVTPNRNLDGGQTYKRNGLLGCTRDATIYDPQRGPGALETKCVFDYSVWMQRWDGGKAIPREIEIQLQQQMLVGDAEGSFRWGKLAVWVCGEMKYFDREPITDLWASLGQEAARFFDEVANDREPEPLGDAIEVPFLRQAFPIRKGAVLDLSAETEIDRQIAAMKWAEQVRLLQWHDSEKSGHEKASKAIKAQLEALATDYEEVLFPHGIKVALKEQSRNGFTVQPTTFKTLKVHVPENLPDTLMEE